jgi:hypothetical protein
MAGKKCLETMIDADQKYKVTTLLHSQRKKTRNYKTKKSKIKRLFFCLPLQEEVVGLKKREKKKRKKKSI